MISCFCIFFLFIVNRLEAGRSVCEQIRREKELKKPEFFFCYEWQYEERGSSRCINKRLFGLYQFSVDLSIVGEQPAPFIPRMTVLTSRSDSHTQWLNSLNGWTAKKDSVLVHFRYFDLIIVNNAEFFLADELQHFRMFLIPSSIKTD